MNLSKSDRLGPALKTFTGACVFVTLGASTLLNCQSASASTRHHHHHHADSAASVDIATVPRHHRHHHHSDDSSDQLATVPTRHHRHHHHDSDDTAVAIEPRHHRHHSHGSDDTVVAAVTYPRHRHHHYEAQVADADVSPSPSGSVVDVAERFQGTRYVFGGTSRSGFDCSGFVRYVLGESAGVSLPRTAQEQYDNGISISRADLQPGDLVFFRDTYCYGISHVGIYIGNGNFIHAANEREGVTTSSLDEAYYERHYAGARRVIFDREYTER